MTARGWSALALLLVACSGDDAQDIDVDASVPDEPNPGFVKPTVTTRAYEQVGGVWEDQGPANWDCLGTPSDDVPPGIDTPVTGQTLDYQTADAVKDVRISATESGNAFDSDSFATTQSDDEANYVFVIPADTVRVSVRLTDETDMRFVDTYLLHHYWADLERLEMASFLTWASIPAFVGLSPSPETALIAGTATDCNGRTVRGAIATVSATRDRVSHIPNADTYYYTYGGRRGVAPHDWLSTTNVGGKFFVFDLPADQAGYIQVWGFVEGQNTKTDPMTLLSELPVTTFADSWISAGMEPRRSP